LPEYIGYDIAIIIYIFYKRGILYKKQQKFPGWRIARDNGINFINA